MKAVFVHRDALLRDSDLSMSSDPDSWRLVPATLEAVRSLAGTDTLLFIYSGCDGAGGEVVERGLYGLVRQIEAAGGRVDGLVTCPHGDRADCKCWGESAQALWGPALQFGLHMNECYVVGDSADDVTMAYAAGARPIMVLNHRTLAEVLGKLPEHKGFPVATDLSIAAGYVGVEEEISHTLGHPRLQSIPPPPTDSADVSAPDHPAVTVVSPMARALQVQLYRPRAGLRDVSRWLSFLVLGVLGLSLGIAYMLTHLYRVQPFPRFVYYLTLQFIPRPMRGTLFIVMGLVIIFLAVRAYYRSPNLPFPGRRKEQRPD